MFNTFPIKFANNKRNLFVKLQIRECSVPELASCNETQTSETKCTEACWSNYPAKRRVMRLELQKQSA